MTPGTPRRITSSELFTVTLALHFTMTSFVIEAWSLDSMVVRLLLGTQDVHISASLLPSAGHGIVNKYFVKG